MYYFVTASKDASLYLQQPTQNTGRDEILEVSKTYYGNLKDIARSVIKFDTTPLSQSIVSGDVTMSAVDLILRDCESNEIPIDYTIYAYQVSQSWDMGEVVVSIVVGSWAAFDLPAANPICPVDRTNRSARF